MFIGQPNLGGYGTNNTGLIIGKVTSKRWKINESKVTEGTVEEHCRNVVPLLKFIPGFESANAI
jgi:hypothetical protein